MSVGITRDAFLYLEPSEKQEDFAQCGSCRFQVGGQCAVIGIDVDAGDSCAVYLPPADDAADEPIGESITAEDAGFVSRQVRCENCMYFDGSGTCELFVKLNKLPDFDLATRVNAYGCCNAQTPKQRGRGFAEVRAA